MDSQPTQDIIKETKTLTLNIRNELFTQMKSSSRKHTKDEHSLTLSKTALNDYLAKPLSMLENEKIKITHKSSKISDKLDRVDSKQFSAFGMCTIATKCKVTYNFSVKNKCDDDPTCRLYLFSFGEGLLSLKTLHRQ